MKRDASGRVILDGKGMPVETLVVDVAKLRALFIEWHTEDHLTSEEIADYADRLLERVKSEV